MVSSRHPKQTEILDNIVCVILFSIGIYLIYLGDVVQMYQRRRTNFAEYEEEVSELPVILTYIQFSRSLVYLKYGEDFNISYVAYAYRSELEAKNMTPGENEVAGSQLKVNFDVQTEFTDYLGISEEGRQVCYLSLSRKKAPNLSQLFLFCLKF